MKAAVNFGGGAASKIPDKEAILLAIIWLRSGLSFSKLAEPTKWNARIVARAVMEGIGAVAPFLEEFTLCGPLKSLVDIADVEDIKELTEIELGSQFIVDGRHAPAGKIGREVERKSCCSYKPKHGGYQFRCITTHTGQCVHVSEGESREPRHVGMLQQQETTCWAASNCTGAADNNGRSGICLC